MNITRLGPDPTDTDVADQTRHEEARDTMLLLAHRKAHATHAPVLTGPSASGNWWVACHRCGLGSDALPSEAAALALHATWHTDTKENAR